jgi:4-oxalocrotonate tautomerase
MPHVIVKLVPGRSEEQKAKLTNEIVHSVTSVLNCSDDLVSVAFEEISPRDWTEHVYKPDIEGKWDTLSKKPGYKPFEKRE